MSSEYDAATGGALVTQTEGRPRQIIPVDDEMPVYSTAHFDHMGRIAAIMAKSSLVPTTLIDKPDSAIANCFQVVEIAYRWKKSPFAVAQCASVVYGKLMFEGKLIQAILEESLGITLSYYFKGTWGQMDYHVYAADRELTREEYDQLQPHEQQSHPWGVKIVDGSVGEWHTKEKNSQNMMGAWKNQPDQQLVYRSTRQWARRFKGGVMIGIIAIEEAAEIFTEQLRVTEALPALAAGFPDEPPGSPRTGAKAEPTERAPNGSGPPSAALGGQEPAKSPGPAPAARPTQPKPAPAAAAPKATAASATAASPTSPDPKASSPPAPEPQSDDGVKEPTHAAPGEMYLLAGDVFDKGDKMRPVYKDGREIGRADAKAANKLDVFDKHAPPAEPDDDAEAEGLEGVSNAQDLADLRNGEGEQGGAETTTQSPDTSAASSALDMMPLDEAFTDIGEAPSWNDIRQLVEAVVVTEEWDRVDEGARLTIRQRAWDRYVELRETGQEDIEPALDLKLFGLWLEFGAQSEEEINGMWRIFWRKPAFREAMVPDQTWVTELMTHRKAALKGDANG